MSIWSKVLVGLILATVLPFFYLSVRLLKTNQAWRTQVNAWEKRLQETEDGNPAAGKLSLSELAKAVETQKTLLHDVVADRGRVWTGVKPEKPFDGATGEGAVIVDAPNPHQIQPKMILFAFSGSELSGRVHRNQCRSGQSQPAKKSRNVGSPTEATGGRPPASGR